MIRDEAEALAIALRNDFADVRDAVQWAEAVIALEQHPHWSVCDVALATAKRSSEVADMLVEIPGTPDYVFVMDLLVVLIHRVLNASETEDVARGLYQMAIAGNIKDGDLQNVAMWASDALYLADARIIGDREDVINKMRNALAIAAERAKSRGHQWQFLFD